MLTLNYHTNRAYHAAHAAEDRDRAAEARHGGRLATQPYTQGWTADTLALSARVLAQGKPDSAVMLPESAFDWPIYRAAAFADVYAALWGQASEAEETILATLALCAGLR